MRALAVGLLLFWTIIAPAGTIDTVAGTGKAEAGPAGGAALATNIGEPFGVEIGPDGALYICEVRNHRVRRLDFKANELTTVAGSGRRGYSGDGQLATKAELNEPYEVRFDRAGNMVFVEMKNHLVRKVEAKSGLIHTIAGTGQEGFGGDGGPATKATFRQPHSIVFDPDDNLYIADIGNHRIRRVDAKSGIITTIAGNGGKALPVEGARASDMPVLGPRSLCMWEAKLVVALREGNGVWLLDLAADKWSHIAGTGKKGYSGDGGPAKQATFDGPKGVALGPKGMLYVVDTENHAIRKVELMQGEIVTVAGAGPDFTSDLGDGGEAVKARLARPHGVCVDREGIIYIGDSNHHRVRRVKE